MPKRTYTEAEIRWIAEQYRTHRAAEVARRYAAAWGRTISVQGVRRLMSDRGIKSGRPPGVWIGEIWATWNPTMIDWLRAHRAEDTIGPITERFNRRFGLAFKASQIASACKRHGIRAGSDGCFRPGDRSWNAGLIGYNPAGRSLESRFQPGNIPWTTMPVGSYRTSKGGFWLIKVSAYQPANYSRRDWREVHRLTWIAAHGPIPPGHVVAFLDGNPDNCLDPNNLACIERSVLSRLNQMGWASLLPDVDLRRAAIASAKLLTEIHRTAERAGMDIPERRRMLPAVGRIWERLP